MLRRFGLHLRDQWMGAAALFLVLAGGTAYAVDGSLPGQNTVGSEDIINNDILSKDIADGRIFNVDLADNLITGQKMKDNSITGADIDEASLRVELQTGGPPAASGCDALSEIGRLRIVDSTYRDFFGVIYGYSTTPYYCGHRLSDGTSKTPRWVQLEPQEQPPAP